MKSSTLRRSNLTKERIAVLEELAKNSKKRPYKVIPSSCLRESKVEDKEKELNVLWQNFRVNQKTEKSPGIYLATGFIAGAVAMLIMTTLLSFSMQSPDTLDVAPAPSLGNIKEKVKLNFIPADKKVPEEIATTQKGTEAYTVKDGDTLAGIIVRFYGSYDLSKVEKIKQANNMENPNNLKIGQNLIIPMD